MAAVPSPAAAVLQLDRGRGPGLVGPLAEAAHGTVERADRGRDLIVDRLQLRDIRLERQSLQRQRAAAGRGGGGGRGRGGRAAAAPRRCQGGRHEPESSSVASAVRSLPVRIVSSPFLAARAMSIPAQTMSRTRRPGTRISCGGRGSRAGGCSCSRQGIPGVTDTLSVSAHPYRRRSHDVPAQTPGGHDAGRACGDVPRRRRSSLAGRGARPFLLLGGRSSAERRASRADREAHGVLLGLRRRHSRRRSKETRATTGGCCATRPPCARTTPRCSRRSSISWSASGRRGPARWTLPPEPSVVRAGTRGTAWG